jgi:ATP-dependent RNA helicase DDX35
VFLPGSEDIDNAIAILEERVAAELDHQESSTSRKRGRHGHDSSLSRLILMPLYSSLPAIAQMKVFDRTPPGYRKVIFSTNIAETSVTIEGICFVVDTGFVKTTYFDAATGITALIAGAESKATARQRAGRAGRTREGKCFRLMTEKAFGSLPEFSVPEMQRSDISGAVLQLKALGIRDVVHFDFLSPPPAENMIYALELLYSLGALDNEGNMTETGENMALMPLEPRLAKALLSSIDFGCTEEILSIASMCSVEYPFLPPRGRVSLEQRQHFNDCISEFAVLEGDHLSLLKLFNSFVENQADAKSWCDSFRLQYRILLRAKEMRHNLQKMFMDILPPGSAVSSSVEDTVAVRKALICGYFGNAAKLGSDGRYLTVRGEQRVEVHSTSVLSRFGAPPEWVIFHDVVHTNTAQIRDVTKIEPLWLLELASSYYDSDFLHKQQHR